MSKKKLKLEVKIHVWVESDTLDSYDMVDEFATETFYNIPSTKNVKVTKTEFIECNIKPSRP